MTFFKAFYELVNLDAPAHIRRRMRFQETESPVLLDPAS